MGHMSSLDIKSGQTTPWDLKNFESLSVWSEVVLPKRVFNVIDNKLRSIKHMN
jgi:hypothetical protein